jgi:hypothetical protein
MYCNTLPERWQSLSNGELIALFGQAVFQSGKITEAHAPLKALLDSMDFKLPPR